MSLNTPVLKCGDTLSVRSNKAYDRLVSAKNVIQSVEAKYTFKGISADRLSLFENQYEFVSIDENELIAKICAGAVFFDQTPYMISIHLPEAEDAYLFSPLATLCDSSDWDPDTHRLSIPINFGNDLGDFELCWEWLSIDGELYNGSMQAQVFSYKLDIYSHFTWMLNEVTERFSWIRLDLLRQTTWGWKNDSDSDADMQTWLLIFQKVKNDLDERLRKLVEQHRRRLVPENRMLKAEKIRRIPPRMEEKITEGILKNPCTRYSVTKKVLDADTPENRYMKHILFYIHTGLNSVIDRIGQVDRISSVFKERLAEWSDELGRIKQHRFWKGIGTFHGLRHESLILSQDPLYAGIRRSWYLLQQGLEFLDQDLRGGIQNAAQLYEIWCLVKIDQLLKDSGWLSSGDEGIGFERSDVDFENDELTTGTVKFIYSKTDYPKVKLDLLFQPRAGAKPEAKGIWTGMVSIPVVQKPDIVLRLHREDLPRQPVYTWIFDAKYRLEGNNAPDDAVNQMHRYRDAILWSNHSYGTKNSDLTRESIGSYVLYPGNEKSNCNFPQIDSIDKTNIGAYPLRPNKNKELPTILGKKLKQLLEIRCDYDGVMDKEAEYFSSVPIVKRKGSGIIGIGAVRSDMNTDEYWDKCRLYRIPLSEIEKSGYNPEVWEYIAPQKNKKEHYGLFPIIKTEKLYRKKIKAIYQKSGIHISSKIQADNKEYWLFTLSDKIDSPPDLMNLKKGSVVNIDNINKEYKVEQSSFSNLIQGNLFNN